MRLSKIIFALSEFEKDQIAQFRKRHRILESRFPLPQSSFLLNELCRKIIIALLQIEQGKVVKYGRIIRILWSETPFRRVECLSVALLSLGIVSNMGVELPEVIEVGSNYGMPRFQHAFIDCQSLLEE